MARTNRTAAQARIARLVSIRQRSDANAKKAIRTARDTKPMNAMMAACLAAAGFDEHSSYC